MTIFNLLLVAVIQGITEFLPVSSSGHLILLPYFTDFQDQGQVIDVAVHVGTLFAVMLYFRRDVALCIDNRHERARARHCATRQCLGTGRPGGVRAALAPRDAWAAVSFRRPVADA